MDEIPDLSKGRQVSLADFVADLRSLAFKSKMEAAEHFHLNHSTISRYENIDGFKAPIGYLAGLAVMVVALQKDEIAGPLGKPEYLLKEINKIIRAEYEEEVPFKNWEGLVAAANNYIQERNKIHADKNKREAGSTSNNKSSTLEGAFQIPPLPPQGVFGREDNLEQISEMLALKELDAESIPPLALKGMGGIGKTTLAIAFAHRPEIKSSLRDGVLWTSLGPKPTVRLLLNAWGRALGVDLLPEHDESACQRRLRQALYDRHMLIIVDDVWDMIQGGYFEVGGPYCRTLFTTREVPIAHKLATRERTLRVEVLKPEAALMLLYKLAPETVAVDKNISVRLCEKLEFLPLGLTLAGRMLANEADVPQRMQRLVGELVDRRESRLQLMQEEGRPGVDEKNPVSLQAILGMSVERLSQLDQQRFAMLSVFGGEPLTWETTAVSAVWECETKETEATISRLIQRGLVELHGDHYWMHALLADYADEMRRKMEL